jgi:glycosyltransferase involved in cell wall biosynthesis
MLGIKRKNGISTLIACQNEEVTVGWSILSFLDFSDEIIVVDNGSTDSTKDICRELARQYPEKVKFFDVPHLKDLYENRQYALERSQYKWIVRADADFVCYTNGENDCRELRAHLMECAGSMIRPEIYNLIQPNVYGDFWHTGDDDKGVDGRKLGGVSGGKRLPVIAGAMPRIYQWFPGFRFDRLGRTEGVRIPRVFKRLIRHINWPKPIWMHCSIKSDLNLLYRSERTNWRALGDYKRYPTLQSYLCEQLLQERATNDIPTAAKDYVEAQLLPYLKPYEPSAAYPYPSLATRAMEECPVYRIKENSDGSMFREYLGVDRSEFSVGEAASQIV